MVSKGGVQLEKSETLLLVDRQETPDIETSSDEYAQRFDGEVGAWFLEVQEEATLRMLAAYPGAEILDVGGGHGQITSALLREGYRVTVLGSAEVCKTRIEHLLDQKHCTFEVGSMCDLPYPDRSFDIVISYRVLAHVVAWKQHLCEFARVARHVVIVDFPSKRSANYLAPYFFHLKRRMEGNTRPFISYREDQMIKQFEGFGFHFEDRYPEFFFPMVVHRVLHSPKLSAVAEKACRRIGLTDHLGTPVIIKLIRGGS